MLPSYTKIFKQLPVTIEVVIIAFYSAPEFELKSETTVPRIRSEATNMVPPTLASTHILQTMSVRSFTTRDNSEAQQGRPLLGCDRWWWCSGEEHLAQVSLALPFRICNRLLSYSFLCLHVFMCVCMHVVASCPDIRGVL